MWLSGHPIAGMAQPELFPSGVDEDQWSGVPWLPSPLIRRRLTDRDFAVLERLDCEVINCLSRARMASMISSNDTTRPAGVLRSTGAASIAQASDAHDARMARFSLSE